MAKAVQIIARGPREQAQAAFAAIEVDPALEAAACSLIEEDEARGIWRLDAWPQGEDEARSLCLRLAAFPGLAVASEVLADADWLALALSGLPPVRAGRFFIYGAHDFGRAPANSVRLRIEAGAAFGTGHHATTLLCLIAYHALIKQRRFERVLDLGTGAGILAIAAARTGARRVIGSDIDPVSVRVAAENAKLNRARCRFVLADGLAHPSIRRTAPFDLVFANILAGPLVRLAPAVRRSVGPGGVAILSGLLASQARAVAAAYLSRGFRLRSRLRRDAWASLILIRR
ncbi:MAG: 50S ribosomal protein L11 methyltransferase [Caulobacteraceae bacterium]